MKSYKILGKQLSMYSLLNREENGSNYFLIEKNGGGSRADVFCMAGMVMQIWNRKGRRIPLILLDSTNICWEDLARF